MILSNPFETGVPVKHGDTWYVYYDGTLMPAIYGGAEAQDDKEDDGPPPAPDLPTIIAAVTKEVGKTLRASLKPVQEKLTVFDSWRQEVDARFKPQESDEGESDPVLPGMELSEDDKARKTQADGMLKKQVRELSETVARLTTENREAQKRAEEMSQKERLANRDRQLTDSLSQLGVVSLDGGLKYFKDDVHFDDETEEWSYSTKDGARYTIPEMVNKFTPDWLRKPLNQAGGSGGGKPTGAAAHKAEITKVRTLHQEAQTTGNNAAAMAYWRARKDAIAKGIPVADLDAAVS